MSYICRIVELQNQLNYANKKFGKLQEQLMQTTEQQFEDKWIGHYNEKDERYICTYACVKSKYVRTFVHTYVCTEQLNN